MRAREQRSCIGGQDGGEDRSGQPEEHEHPLGDARVALGDLKGVGDVVDQVLDILLDRASLNSDPESAVAQTRDAARARAQDLATSFAGAVLWWSA